MIDTTLDPGFTNVLMIIRHIGESLLRPAGLEADRTGKPIPEDHPMFAAFNRTGLSFGAVGMGKNSKSATASRVNRAAIIAAEEMAYWCQGACMSLPGPGLGAPPIRILGTDDQKRRFLEPRQRGITITCFLGNYGKGGGCRGRFFLSAQGHGL